MASPDPYATLGVSRDASDAEIKRAFRKLARKYHPDRNPDDSAAEAKFKEVQAAYETIGDASKRQEYDQKKRMENMFGGGGRSPFGGGMGWRIRRFNWTNVRRAATESLPATTTPSTATSQRNGRARVC